MILKAKERGDGAQLAQYLLTVGENDHVELHEVRGFISDDLAGAFQEADAVALGTRCQKHLFSMSFNPPADGHPTIEDFEQAIDRVERKLGLEGQPRAIVFHEKDGRRHAHAVWSRIDSDRMRAINLPFYKERLREVSRELFLEHEWNMPRGLEDRRLRDPSNFTHEQWQQARRAGLDAKELKAVFRKAWESSDNRAAFEQALKERGFRLAKGDRRGFVAVDYRGEVYSVARYASVRAKDVKARLGDPGDLPSVDQVKADIADRMTAKIETFIKQTERDAAKRLAQNKLLKAEIVARHSTERQQLTEKHEARWQAETLARAARLPKGISGIWHRLTGRYAKVRAQNELDTLEALRRDGAEKDDLIVRQLDQRQVLQQEILIQREAAQSELLQLREDVARYMDTEQPEHARSRKTEHRHDPDGNDDGPTRNRRGPRLEP
jgi:hypothetical protein